MGERRGERCHETERRSGRMPSLQRILHTETETETGRQRMSINT